MTRPRHGAGPDHLVMAARAAGVRDERVVEAVRSTPREAFVPARYAGMAYADEPVPISHGQVTSQPSLIATNLAGQGIGNAVVITGDGSQGAPGYAPFGAIIISAAFPDVPPPLTGQLTEGGRLVQPVGPGGGEHVTVYRKTGTGLIRDRVLTAASFVRLHGRYGYPLQPR